MHLARHTRFEALDFIIINNVSYPIKACINPSIGEYGSSHERDTSWAGLCCVIPAISVYFCLHFCLLESRAVSWACDCLKRIVQSIYFTAPNCKGCWFRFNCQCDLDDVHFTTHTSGFIAITAHVLPHPSLKNRIAYSSSSPGLIVITEYLSLCSGLIA